MGIYFDRTINNRLRGVSRMESLEIILERYDGPALSEARKVELATMKNDLYRESLHQLSPADLSAEVKDTLDASKHSRTPAPPTREGRGSFSAQTAMLCVFQSQNRVMRPAP